MANHTCLISRDGREIVIADSGAPIRDNESRVIGVVLVFRDMTEAMKLQRELDETSRELRLLQDEARRRVSGRESRSASEELDLVMRQADAQRNLVTIQTGLSTALPRAPGDGYVVRFFYAVGSEAKRRKPILEFVAAGKTALGLALPAAAAARLPAELAPGTVATIVSSEGGRRFSSLYAGTKSVM